MANLNEARKAAEARRIKDAALKAAAEKTRAEQPLPVPIFPKADKALKPSLKKLWAGGEHGKAARIAAHDGKCLAELKDAVPEDAALIDETVATVGRG